MLDQVFVLLKYWLLGFSPAALQPAVSILLTILPILLVFPVLFALTTVLERKGLGRIHMVTIAAAIVFRQGRAEAEFARDRRAMGGMTDVREGTQSTIKKMPCGQFAHLLIVNADARKR